MRRSGRRPHLLRLAEQGKSLVAASETRSRNPLQGTCHDAGGQALIGTDGQLREGGGLRAEAGGRSIVRKPESAFNLDYSKAGVSVSPQRAFRSKCTDGWAATTGQESQVASIPGLLAWTVLA
jgi:hypothetical protein